MGKGQFYCIENVQDYDIAVADYIGGLMSTFAHYLRVNFSCPEGVKLVEVMVNGFGIKNQSNNSVEINLGTLYLDEVRNQQILKNNGYRNEIYYLLSK